MPKQPATLPVLAPLPERESAHDRSVTSDLRDALHALVDALGASVTAAIIGKDPNTLTRWQAPAAWISVDDERRLRNAFHIFTLVVQADDEDVARAWFLGMNPQLDDDSPVERLAADDARAVLAAARSFVSAG
ncbi:hypothetical protein [uncultured Microbacterium sp.]|jgi:hypothetical protein|uniref:hypothetical protein n=1 Tax=uncultured Microbacterium sp. TaxID=191216 RepID=UPI0026296840|nr:hypothetical protein [uncultured Microbacterium sp.]